MKDETRKKKVKKSVACTDDSDGGAESEFRVEDKRHWTLDEEALEQSEAGEAGPRKPTLIDEYRERAEAAETKLQEYIEAFKQHQREQDEFRARLERDVDRKVALKFGELVRELLETVDTLDLGLAHVDDVPQAEPLADGVRMARDRFLSILERHGIEKIVPEGLAFDPEEAEAVRVDPVGSPEMNGKVTETLQPGYRLGDLVVRAAKVAVGRHTAS